MAACIVRQAQEQTGPEPIRPDTLPLKLAVTHAASQVHNNVCRGKPDMGWKLACAKAFISVEPEQPAACLRWQSKVFPMTGAYSQP
jgi:hypothetical protein